MKSQTALAVLAGCAAGLVSAQSASSSLPRGSSMQSWQNPGIKNVLAKCKNPPQPFSIPISQSATASTAPPAPALPATTAIPGVLAAGQSWKVVWSWEGNNVDGPIADDNGTVLFANNDASNVMQMDPATGLAKVLYSNTNTGGAVSRGKNGALFVAERGIGSGIEQLEPQRKMLANSFRGEPLECVGGVINDLMADSRGGVYFSVTGATGSGVFYADPKGVVSQYGTDVPLANGIILSPDEKTLYVTNGAVVFAFDVKPDGSLTNQPEFSKLRGGQSGDGSAVDQQAACRLQRASRWTSARPTARSPAASQARKACTARCSAAATRGRSSAYCFTAGGERRARETVSSRFQRSRKVIPDERSS